MMHILLVRQGVHNLGCNYFLINRMSGKLYVHLNLLQDRKIRTGQFLPIGSLGAISNFTQMNFETHFVENNI